MIPGTFTDRICKPGLYCRVCRDREAGRPHRVTWLTRNGSTIAPDFECPEGKPWGYAPSRGLGDTIAKRTSAVGIKPCGGCKRRRDSLNKLLPYE